MAHTPGPWSVVLNGDFHRIKVNGSTVYSVADVTSPDYQCISPPRHCVDDLLLMAAAPEMLAALKRVVDQANCAMDYSGVDAEHTLKRAMERISKAKCVCETAIAKAEGRVP
jgi:hypothetical protein